ncbi:MAG: UvrD-helicase domain-containing protein, partial [Eubacteriales bacterium]|nr:UvrD-helicase domain-containing protein [Eubacteriales bacterium]
MRLTPEQERVVKAGSGDLVVSASAGWGQTAVLIQRLLYLICETKTPAERLLVTTFTNAAAAEMKARLARELDEYCEKNPDNVFAAEQLSQINGAHVQTIHSFCIDLLREYFYVAELPPVFRIPDESEFQLLTNDAMQKLFRAGYADENDEVFRRAARWFCRGTDDGDLAALIRKVYD